MRYKLGNAMYHEPRRESWFGSLVRACMVPCCVVGCAGGFGGVACSGVDDDIESEMTKWLTCD